MKTFACTFCGKCCSNLGPDRMILLRNADIQEVALGLDLSVEEVEREYCEINDAVSAIAGLDVRQLKSVEGNCVFLASDNKCSVHAFKPFQCRHGPENFLRRAMIEDYECMRGIDVEDTADQSEIFFRDLLSGG